MKGTFTTHNTLTSTNRPTFNHRRDKSQNKRPAQQLGVSARTTSPSELPAQTIFATTDSTNSISLSDFGDSSSLFSYNTTASFDLGGTTRPTNTQSPIPFVFGVSADKASRESRIKSNKMVNERSPAKAPLRPVAPNEQPQSQSDGSSKPLPQPDLFSSRPPPSSVPQFGQPTIPHSPLNRGPSKQSSMFIQPTTRPELHRDADRPAHPNLQAMKDATRKIMQPLMPRAPAEYNQPVRAPVPQATSYTTTAAAPAQMYGSMGSTYGGFNTVNSGPTYKGYNYVDLTMNGYRDPVPDPYTFVDPKKAEEDLKALLEGVIEDDEDVPRTRLRKKKKQIEADDLAKKFKKFNVDDDGEEEEEEGKLAVASEDEEEEEDDGSVEGVKVKLLPHQIEGLEWMRGRELGTGKKGARVPKGGILADDMGLGKTLQSVSLILTNPKPTDEALIAKRKLPSGVEKTTLVVAPLALIRQWELEIKDKVLSSHSLRVCVHHGPSRTKRFQDLKKYDVVVTTYQILVSEWGNSSTDDDGLKVGCFGLHWYRVILDEAHTIKNRNAKASLACCALRTQYRWCLTGTPMQNNLDELQSLIKFLRISPYNDLKEWKDAIDRPMKNGRGDIAIQRLRAVLKIFMKRRTKDILKKEGALNPGGKPSAPGEGNMTGFKITERRIEKVFAEFSPEESDFYARLEARTDASIEQMMSGKVNYASALVMLLRLRQACNHPKLVGGKLAKDSEALAVESTATQKASKASNNDIDDMADMFGAMGMASKKCEVCQLELGDEVIAQGGIRCLDCEADLDRVTNPKKVRKEKKKRKHEKKPKMQIQRKLRNRAIIEDSDDEGEEQEGSWVVPEGQRGALTLGKAGGIDDENAEGGGEWLNSDDDDTLPTLDNLRQHKSKTSGKKVIALDSDSEDAESASEDDSNTGSEDEDSAVEDEFESSSEESKLATMVSSTKIRHLMEILDKEAAQHKFIVFSQFTSMLDLVEPFLRQKGFKYTRYDGKMKNDLREASLNKLRNDANCRVLLCSLKCGSLGLNLTAATRVVILEPFWNPFVEEQAIDRVHRLTQKIDVIVYKITIKNSVEERILDLQEKKRELANQTIEGGKGGAGKLGMKEILQLFRRDAEHAPPNPGNEKYDLGKKPRILKEVSTSSGASSREGSERRITPPMMRPSSSIAKENPVYGRRW